jgi:hypothetical protein
MLRSALVFNRGILFNTHPYDEVVSPPTDNNSSEPVAMYCIKARVGSDDGKSVKVLMSAGDIS